jgi:ribosomal protein S18 acetylase RimI-like enzyme
VDDPVFAAARNLAGWHDAWVRALGLPTAWDDDLWRAPAGAPFIYFTTITLRRGLAAVPVDRPPVCDSFAELELEGLVPHDEQWLVRPAVPVAVEPPPELELERVTTAAGMEEFERASLRGFEVGPVEPGSIHPAAALAEPRLAVWLGRVDGEAVSSATSFVDDGAVGVYAVATVPEARGRGYGAALTARCVADGAGLPAVLTPSELAVPLYERLGFRRVATFRVWSPTR